MSKQTGQRLDWADTAKGIGIILVVAGHTSLDYTWVGSLIHSFHMPIFFFLSGYFFHTRKYKGPAAFLMSKAKTLLVPYAVFAAVSYAYFLLRYHFGDPDYYKDLSMVKQFYGIFYSAGTREWMDFNLPLWFLTCLFAVECIYYFLSRAVRSRRLLLFILFASALAGYADSVWNPVKLPWGIDVALTATVFFGSGQLLKGRFEPLLEKPRYVQLAAIAGLLLVSALSIHGRVNMNMKVFGHFYDFYTAAFAGISICILLSNQLKTKWLPFLGKHAMIIMACHMPVLNISTKITSHLHLTANLYTMEALRTAVTILLIVPIIYGLDIFVSFILGRFNPAPASAPEANAFLKRTLG